MGTHCEEGEEGQIGSYGSAFLFSPPQTRWVTIFLPKQNKTNDKKKKGHGKCEVNGARSMLRTLANEKMFSLLFFLVPCVVGVCLGSFFFLNLKDTAQTRPRCTILNN